MSRGSLVEQLLPVDARIGQVIRWRDAVVDGTSPLTITIGGATGIPAVRLAHYTPTIGDKVSVRQTEGRLLVEGKYA